MVVLNRITTKTGDDGTGALVTGERRLKSDPRFEAIGTVDELNATIGFARLSTIGELDQILARIQNDLFDLGADLATPEGSGRDRVLRITESQVARLETEAALLNGELAPLRSFVLPGGTSAAAALHVCRTVCRRAERTMVALMNEAGEPLNPAALRFINRLSDLLFLAARSANDSGASDILWEPGGNR